MPIVGVIWWGWDAFLLLLLYWCETVIIAFWTIVRLALGPGEGDAAASQLRGKSGRLAMAAFFTVHSGIFITVHFVFLWTIFSGGWSSRVHGVGAFFRDLIIGTDLWLPLIILFLVRGYIVMGLRIGRRLGLADGGAEDQEGSPVAALYVRIFVMQVTIIAGGWFAILAGDSVGPLMLLVLAKTVAEVFFDPMLSKAAESGANSTVGTTPDRTPAD